MKQRIVILMLLVLFIARGYAGCLYDSVPELPLIVMPAEANANTPLVLFITGDGGWKNFDPRLAQQFLNRQAPVVALNALHYFWSRKTPEQTTATVQMLLEKYMKRWHKQTFILVGFSFGADVMPFIVNRLPDTLMRSCKGVALFSPGTTTDFEIHLSQMMSSHRRWRYDVVKEMESMKPVRLLSFFGDEEHEFPVKILSKPGWQVIYLHGGHHYEENKDDIGKMVLEKLGIERRSTSCKIH
jgi:type IV secretory pathway VirJ component